MSTPMPLFKICTLLTLHLETLNRLHVSGRKGTLSFTTLGKAEYNQTEYKLMIWFIKPMSEDFNSIHSKILFCLATLTLCQRISGFRSMQKIGRLNILDLLYSSPQSESFKWHVLQMTFNGSKSFSILYL